MIGPVTRVFGLSVSQIGRRIKAATKVTGLGEGFTGHSPRVGMAQDLSARRRGAAGTDDSGGLGQPNHAGPVHRSAGRRQGRGGPILPGNLRR